MPTFSLVASSKVKRRPVAVMLTQTQYEAHHAFRLSDLMVGRCAPKSELFDAWFLVWHVVLASRAFAVWK